MEKKWTSATELKIFKRARRFVRNILTGFFVFFFFLLQEYMSVA